MLKLAIWEVKFKRARPLFSLMAVCHLYKFAIKYQAPRLLLLDRHTYHLIRCTIFYVVANSFDAVTYITFIHTLW